MKEIIFRIANRDLLKLGWQNCIAECLTSSGYHPGDIPRGAKLAHRPLPNKAQTVFYIFVLPEGSEVPIMQTGKVRDFFEFMADGQKQEAVAEINQREALIQQCIREQEQSGGSIIH